MNILMKDILLITGLVIIVQIGLAFWTIWRYNKS